MRHYQSIIRDWIVLKLASWNVNSLKVRLEQVLTWLQTADMDILALQETKLVDQDFPAAAFQQLGYHVVYSGQKTYNGVALISKHPVEDVVTDIPGFEDPQRRILAAAMAGIRVINLYVPNGAEVDSDKYHYKLHWLEKVTDFIKQQLATYTHVAVVGDFNIAPEDRDVHDPKAWEGSVLVSPLERSAFSTLLALGLTDSFRHFNQDSGYFTWWDYRAAAFRRNLGLRIDHVLLNQPLTANCRESVIDVTPRRNERPSDHTPIYVSLNGD